MNRAADPTDAVPAPGQAPEARARALFQKAFGGEPAALAAAPGRVNLIGEHVDYHGGQVLPMAIPQRTAVALGPAAGVLRTVSERAAAVDAAWPPVHRGDWSDYVVGVVVEMGQSIGALQLGGLAAAVASDVPEGAGLSSSAALEVATARALAAWAGRDVDQRTLAAAAWRAETGFVGMPCGRMDQLASALAPAGSAILLDCRTYEAQPVPVPCDIVLVDSGEAHALRDSAYAERRREGSEALALLRQQFPALEYLTDIPPARLVAAAASLPAVLARRVKHVVNENQRTRLAAQRLEAGDVASFGTLVNQSHDSLRDLYECSSPGLDAIVRQARLNPRVLGARMIGAGWGGTVLVVTARGDGAEVAASLGGRWLGAGA